MSKNINKLHIIAETACAHDGSIKRLLKMIDDIGRSGSQAIQFRVFDPKNTITINHPHYKKIKKLVLTKKEWIKCFSYTKKRFPKLEIISSVPSLDELLFCNQIGSDAFKLHSADLNNYELLKGVAKIGKRIDLSVGASSLVEIKNALKFINKINKKIKIWLMYGYQLFPTDPKKLNLKRIIKLKNIFNLDVGYQDHSPPNYLGYSIPSLAIGMGINIIEKHVTDKISRKGTDSASAIDSKNFYKFVSLCKEAKISIGSDKFGKFSKEEKKYRKYCKKNLFLSKNIFKGDILKKEDIILLRSNRIGILADNMKKVLGKRLKKNLNKNDQLYNKHLKI